MEPQGRESPLLSRVLYLSRLCSPSLSPPLQLSQSHSQSRWGHFSHVHLQAQARTTLECISPPSVLFNPNLSHSTLNKDATTWSFFRSHSLTLQSQKQKQKRHYCQPTPRCGKHILHCCLPKPCPSVPPFCILPISCLSWIKHVPYFAYVSSNARFYDTSVTTCFPA